MPEIRLPGTVTVAPPIVAAVLMTRPTSDVVVVPVAGPKGERGPQGPAGDDPELIGQLFGFVYTSSNPAYLHQIQHDLGFRPAGIICLEPHGGQIEYDTIKHPELGITEVTFGVPFAGTIYLS